MVLILLAYFLLQIGRVKSNQLSYHVINFMGGLLLLVSLYHAPNIPTIILEICWMAIALFGIYKSLKNASSENK